MINIEKKPEEKWCNCKNSRCVKLYCECYAAQRECGKNCRCQNCQNTGIRDPFKSFNAKLTDPRIAKDDLIKNYKGCACRKSGCTKKYC